MTTIAENARAMRRALTPAEAVLWQILRTPPLDAWHFRRQAGFKPFYIADFASHAAKLVIEADGPSHDLTFEADTTRTAWFVGRGYRVIRFTNTEILADRHDVWREICAQLPSEPPIRLRKPERL